MAIYELDGATPRLGATVWVADSAQVVGRVELADEVSIWFGTIVRGDQPEPVRVGRGSNIQDGCVLHSDPGQPLTIGEGVTVGHRVMLHGCSIGNGTLIGIGAIVLNGAIVGSHCIVGAGSLITEGKEFPDGSLIFGSPATVKRSLGPGEIANLRKTAEHYVVNARRFRETLHRLD